MSEYDDFVLTAEDLATIGGVTDENGKVDWDNPLLANIKADIKRLHLELQNDACCYCRRSFKDEFQLVVDIEHVLPKAQFSGLTFDAVNLSVACKRCNMRIKKDRLDFLNSKDREYVIDNRYDDALYQIIHPNVDIYRRHLSYRAFALDDERLVKYVVLNDSPKGKRTYDYFELQKFEVDSIDRIQGAGGNADSPYAEFVEGMLGS